MVLILSFLFFFFPTFVYADDFSISGDSSSNWFFQATALTVEQFPTQEDVKYDVSQVLGENTTNILNSESIQTLTDFGYMRRIPNSSDRVYGPPGTAIDVLYFYRNDTGHSVNIQDLALPVSRKIVSNGDISKNLVMERVVQDSLVQFLFSGNVLDRGGLYKYYDGIGDIQNGGFGSYKLDRWYIKNPLGIDQIVALKTVDGIHMKVAIQNSSDEYLNNLNFKHLGYEENFSLGAFEEKVVEYKLAISTDSDIEGFEIYNPNIKTRCAIMGGSWYEWNQTDSITIFAQRENSKWVGGGYIQPVVESMCIKRIAYTVNSGSIKIEEEIQKDKGLEEVEMSVQDILGVESKVEKLPQTSKISVPILLLVVVIDMFLWYPFLRRRIYENKDNNSRLCTKSSKNARQRGF